MKFGLVLLFAAAAFATACAPPPAVPTQDFDIDGYCNAAAPVTDGPVSSAVQARTFGILQGPGPADGCAHWLFFEVKIVTTLGEWRCGTGHPPGGSGTPGIGGVCSTIPGPLPGTIFQSEWLRAQADGDPVSASMTVLNSLLGISHIYDLTV
jgi:hypothetical protein